MKKLILCLLMFSMYTMDAQYLRIAEQGKIWYSRASGLGGTARQTTLIIAVEGDTAIANDVYPLLVAKDSALHTIDTLAYLNEDTVAGSLEVKFFNSIFVDQYYDFTLGVGDTVEYTMQSSTQKQRVVVDSVYFVTDFRGIKRKVISFAEVDSFYQGNFCNLAMKNHRWIEGMGSANILTENLPGCELWHQPRYTLTCAFLNGTRIYGDTVQQCFRRTSIEEESIQQVQIFPNPAAGEHIGISSAVPVVAVKFYDMRGKLVLMEEHPAPQIDLGSLSSGMYLLSIKDADGTTHQLSFLRQ